MSPIRIGIAACVGCADQAVSMTKVGASMKPGFMALAAAVGVTVVVWVPRAVARSSCAWARAVVVVCHSSMWVTSSGRVGAHTLA